jgi:hypothetical protein
MTIKVNKNKLECLPVRPPCPAAGGIDQCETTHFLTTVLSDEDLQ